MKASELDLRELLAFSPQGGVIRFAGLRSLILDAGALGILRRELISTLGVSAARAILTRFGFAHGLRMAESLKTCLPWDDETEWRRAGGVIHALLGLVTVEPSLETASGPSPLARAVWHDSYEAEQHLLHLGVAEEPVCWTLCGFAGGWQSRVRGREVYFVEDRCRGKGDAVCHVVGRFREDWGEAITAHLPFYEKGCLEGALAHVTEELKRVERKLRGKRRELGEEAGAREESGIVAQSMAMQRVLDLARRVAKVDSTVLLTGESGVGKERIAGLIHAESVRTGGPFVALNCGAVPESLLESELFGHARGAFTGAAQDRAGLFEAASHGTLFLDEIGEISPQMQVKLLRVLQEKEVRRVGENRNRPVDARVLAATNRDLLSEVHAARFRQDLYYRLRVIEIRVPPLRERREDVLPLARRFVTDASHRMGRKIAGLTPAAAGQLVKYDWPGNVRELENAIERAVVLAKDSRIDAEDLPEEVGHALSPAYAAGETRPLSDVERDYILAVLKANGGNRARTAAQLQIGPATLYRKLKEYGTG